MMKYIFYDFRPLIITKQAIIILLWGFLPLVMVTHTSAKESVMIYTGTVLEEHGHRLLNGVELCEERYSLQQEDGELLPLDATQSKESLADYVGRKVTLQIDAKKSMQLLPIQEETMGQSENERERTILASQGEQSILYLRCSFPELPPIAEEKSRFLQMEQELNNYWHDLSFGRFDLSRSVVSSSYTLPSRLTEYQTNFVTTSQQLTQILQDCTAEAEAEVNFNDHSAIILLLNGSLGASWSGTRPLELDGVEKQWPVVWLMDWGWKQAGTPSLKHEMGHLFGLAHSADAENNVYGNYWDIMSVSWSQHTIGYNKQKLGWLTPQEQLTILPGQTKTIVLHDLASELPNRLKLINIPVVSGEIDHLTAELRVGRGYDSNILSDGLVLHEIDLDRMERNPISGNERPLPAKLATPQQGDGNRAWQAGEQFISRYGVQITIHTIENGQSEVTITNQGYSTFLPMVFTAEK